MGLGLGRFGFRVLRVWGLGSSGLATLNLKPKPSTRNPNPEPQTNLTVGPNTTREKPGHVCCEWDSSSVTSA